MRRKIQFFSMAILTFVLGVFLTNMFYSGLAEQITTGLEIKVDKIEKTTAPVAVNPSNAESEKIALNRNIRSIDFNNFTYHWFPKNENVFKKQIVLRNGENKEVHLEGERYGPLGEDYQEKLMNISYADLTGDGKEEAIVTVGVSFYRWTPMCIFVFSEKNKKAQKIWAYETGTYGSNLQLRGIKVEDGKLLIEEFHTTGAPNCCAKRYIRKTFGWNGKTFEEKYLETFPYYNEVKDFKGYPSKNY